jgi:signal transduction histidine kinase
MLNGVLEFARIEAGRVPLDEQEVPLDELLDAAIRPVRKAADEKSVTIMFGMMIERALHIDVVKMTQVLVNILSNAVKFTPSGGNVDIDADLLNDGGLVVMIRDTGRGIAVEDLERVFQPFGQVDDHLTRENDGIGLGLPIARSLTRLHGGDLVLTSDVGVGTMVEIRLPPSRVRMAAAVQAA